MQEPTLEQLVEGSAAFALRLAFYTLSLLTSKGLISKSQALDLLDYVISNQSKANPELAFLYEAIGEDLKQKLTQPRLV